MKTVLVVEDNDDIRALVVEVLRMDGYVVHEAENGMRALEVLAALQDQPCLVLLDMMMPVMDGAHFLKALGDLHLLGALPVVVVSATHYSRVVGAVKAIKKPVSADLLRQVVREYCGEPRVGPE